MPDSMFPEEADQFYADLYSTQPLTPHPGFFAGSLTAVPTGVASGLGKIGELAGTAAAQTVGIAIRAEQAAAPWSNALVDLDPDHFQQNVDRNADAYLKATRADPETVGTAGQVLHNVADVGTRFLAGPTAAAGAVLAGTSEFAPAKREFALQTDEETANRLAGAQAILTGAGALLPGGVGGKVAVRVASGATINLSVGAAMRYDAHQVLEDAGYTQQAAQYRVFDGQSMAADAILGAFFGFMHTPEKPFATPEVPRDVVDAGLVHLQARQAEIDLAPGIPKTPEARDEHIQNLNTAEDALVRGEPPPPMETPETVPNPAQEAAHEAATEAQGKAADQSADGLLGAGKRQNEPPRSTQEWVAEQIVKERAQQLPPERPLAEGEQPIDAQTKQALDAVDEAIRRNPDLHDFQYEDPETGEKVNAGDALQQIREQARGDQDTAMLHEIAAACAVR